MLMPIRFQGKAIAVSLPSINLVHFGSLSAVFELDLTAMISMPGVVAAALTLLQSEADAKGQKIFIISRPEMYCDASTLDWLIGNLPGVIDHISITDGGTIKKIAGLRNHIWFLYPGQTFGQVSFFEMVKRVPRYFSTFDSQINSCFRFQNTTEDYSVTPTILRSHDNQRDSVICKIDYFGDDLMQSPVSSVRDSAEIAGKNLTYFKLSESAMSNATCLRTIARLIAEAFFASEAVVVIQIAESASHYDEAITNANAILKHLLPFSQIIPKSVPHGVYLVKGPIDPTSRFEKMTMVTDLDTCWWMTPLSFYERFETMVVLASKFRHRLDDAVEFAISAFGENAELVWIEDHLDSRVVPHLGVM